MDQSFASDAEQLVRQFSEDEAVWRCFAEKRRHRRLASPLSLLPEDLLDHLDRVEAVREIRQVRAIGKFVQDP